MKMKMKKLIAFLLSAVLLFSLTACADKKETASDGAVTVTDMAGREISVVPGSYKRVVCIGAGALRLYCYVGDTELLCGVEDIDNTGLQSRPEVFDQVARPYILAYGEKFLSLPSCGVGGPAAQAAEAEKILSCDPDIVVSAYEDSDKADALQEQLGVPVVTVRYGADGVFDEAFSDSMTLLGRVFCREERAAALNSFIKEETAAISALTANIPENEKKTVYICGLGNWGITDHLTTAQNYKPFEVANVSNAVTGLSADGVQAIEAEKFAAIGEDVDVMIIDAAAVGNITALYSRDSSIFDTCAAARQGEVYLQMAYNAYYTNCEIALINTWFIAKSAYPEALADVDMTEKTAEITEAFLGEPLAESIFSCPLSFGGYQQIEPDTFFR